MMLYPRAMLASLSVVSALVPGLHPTLPSAGAGCVCKLSPQVAPWRAYSLEVAAAAPPRVCRTNAPIVVAAVIADTGAHDALLRPTTTPTLAEPGEGQMEDCPFLPCVARHAATMVDLRSRRH